MDDNTQKILGKIKKCFALSKSANVNEASIALKQAYALARKYNLEAKITELAQLTLGKKLSAGNQLNLPPYLARLLNLINFIFQTKSVIHIERISDSLVRNYVDFCGCHSDVMIAEYAWEVLSGLLIRTRTQFLNLKSPGRTNKTNKTYQADYFCRGWLDSIYDEVKTLGREISNEQRLAHAADIENYQNSQQSQALKSKQIKNSPQLNQKNAVKKANSAFIKGHSEGKRVSISKGIATTMINQQLLS